MSKAPLELEVEIHELSTGGDGVAITTLGGEERRAVFVPGSLPGERVRVEIADPSRRPARAKVLEILRPSSSRTDSPCAWVDRCGACDWMHIAPSAQATEHALIVQRLLDAPVTPHAAERTTGYRSRARLHLESRKDGRVLVGMFGRGSHDAVEVETCIVLDPILERVRGQLARWLEGASGRGEARLSLGRPSSDQRRGVLDLHWKGDLPPVIFGRLEKTIATETFIDGARVFAGDVRIPAKIGDPTPFIIGGDGSPLQLAIGGFSQATEEGNAALARRVDEIVRGLDDGSGPCVELFAGAGNLTVLLAVHRDVISVERDADACTAARENLRARNLTAKVVEGDAASYVMAKNTKVVVLDPPREGARAVVEALAKRANRKPAVVYVACDPPTLARDVKTLTAAGWILRSADTFEMFPQTSHVETIAVLVPKPS